MNATARIVTNTWKFDHGLTRIRHDILHWLDVPTPVHRLQVSAWNGTDVFVGDVPADLVGGWPSSIEFS